MASWHYPDVPYGPIRQSLFLEVGGLTARVSPNSDPPAGFLAFVYDGTPEGFLATQPLGKWPDQAEAKAACIAELQQLLPGFDPASVGDE